MLPGILFCDDFLNQRNLIDYLLLNSDTYRYLLNRFLLYHNS